MWFFMTNSGRFRAKLYLHPKENNVSFHIESLRTKPHPLFSWKLSVFTDQLHSRRWVLGLMRMLGSIRKKYTKKTYKMKKQKTLGQIVAPIVVRSVEKYSHSVQEKI